MSPSLQYFWCHSIFNLQSTICLLQMSNTDLKVCSPNGFSAVKVTGMIKRGEKSKPKNICRASNKTPKNPWTQNSCSESPIPKINVHERSYNTGNKWKLNLQTFSIYGWHMPDQYYSHVHHSSDCFEYPKKSMISRENIY